MQARIPEVEGVNCSVVYVTHCIRIDIKIRLSIIINQFCISRDTKQWE